ncbi:hypothetical protein J4221_00885 [Candidatus Pacearchaeota archaeon]|nr:hypothetical protein [Candidatus Pacearchaeota archaeon]
MLKEVLYIIVIFLGIVNGLILSRLCKDEIKKWNKRFQYIAVASLIAAIVIYLTDFNYKIPVIVALLFMTLTSITIYLMTRKML